jgi:hypothetical protein
MKGKQGGYIGCGWHPHKVILHFQYVQSLTKIRRGQVLIFGNIQLTGEPISNGQLHMKNHQSRAQCVTIGMVELTFKTSFKSFIQLQEASVSQHNGMCVAHQCTKNSTSAPELGANFGPALGGVTPKVTEACHFTRTNGAALRIGTKVEGVGLDPINTNMDRAWEEVASAGVILKGKRPEPMSK